MTDSGLSTHCRLAGPGVFDGKVSGNCPDAVWRISYSFMTADEDGSGRRMMGGKVMGRDGRLGRLRCRGKGKE